MVDLIEVPQCGPKDGEGDRGGCQQTAHPHAEAMRTATTRRAADPGRRFEPGKVVSRKDGLIQLGCDGVPNFRRRVAASVGEHRGRLLMVVDLVPAAGAANQVRSDSGGLEGVDGVESERSEQLADRIVTQG
jgi:hypothetical protein